MKIINKEEIPLERFEAELASLSGKSVIVRISLKGTVELHYIGTLNCLTNSEGDTNFHLINMELNLGGDKIQSAGVRFEIKDVTAIQDVDENFSDQSGTHAFKTIWLNED